ncbi:hypothetical protein KN815_21755 [Streptomyces sp. 4503]|uniref:Uncharacterized protein n=1 Tax=Streptomyces niphimycinicus TaxID=2842201 RepID=A0ABS6CIM6_9ACTN|nr:hypothetical protein [Streptomyces niphimycinicus]MBU3866595.1 hypothetical protein [Streptomyces niphimycinicus]
MADDVEDPEAPDGFGVQPARGPESGFAQQQEGPGSKRQPDEDATSQPGPHTGKRKELDQREEDGRGYDDLRRVLGQRVYNNFYGTVDASGAAFGFGKASTPGLAPGTVDAKEIARTLQYYLRPQPCFDEALGRLRSEHIVVLAGQDNTGRGAGSFALLREMTREDADLRSLSPANSLADLAASNAIKPGQGYVILDYVGEMNVDAVQAFEIRRLSEELRRKGTYLVITAGEATRRRLALADYCVQWHAPDPLDLYHHCIDLLPPAPMSSDVASELLDRVRELRRPADVVAAAIALGDGAEAVLEILRDSAKQTVRNWFSEEPTAGDLLPLAALAFLEDIPERNFEEASVQLGLHVRDWELTGEAPAAEQDPSPTKTLRGVTFEQTRARWQERATGLVRVERRPGRGQDASRSERRIVFASPRIRELVIAELHNLYGYELWYPLRQWLSQLSRTGDLDMRTEVARGVALLARHALAEVDENLLQVWADGVASQRVTTALTLQFMCDDEHLAPQTLNIALSWADNKGPARAVTTAMALTGRLGSLYRLEALNWLWFLARRGERMAAAARRSMVLLLQSAEREPARALFTLRYVRTVIASTSQRSRDCSSALRMTVQILEAEGLEDPGPLAAALLRGNPDSARHLGSLWTSVLLSVCRRRAVGALCRTLVALRGDPAVADSVTALGEAMRRDMTSRQWEALRNDLSSALRHPDFAIPGTHQIARLLLGSLKSRPPTGRRPAGSSLLSAPPISSVSSARGGRST